MEISLKPRENDDLGRTSYPAAAAADLAFNIPVPASPVGQSLHAAQQISRHAQPLGLQDNAVIPEILLNF